MKLLTLLVVLILVVPAVAGEKSHEDTSAVWPRGTYIGDPVRKVYSEQQAMVITDFSGPILSKLDSLSAEVRRLTTIVTKLEAEALRIGPAETVEYWNGQRISPRGEAGMVLDSSNTITPGAIQ
jgi:hypothetical protein